MIIKSKSSKVESRFCDSLSFRRIDYDVIDKKKKKTNTIRTRNLINFPSFAEKRFLIARVYCYFQYMPKTK